MDSTPIKQVFEELYSLLEDLEAKNIAILRFLADEGLAPQEKLAPYLENAGNASSVKWRAARVRMAHLFAPPPRRTTDEVSKPEKAQAREAKSEQDKSEHAKSEHAKSESALSEKTESQKTDPQESGHSKSGHSKSEPGQSQAPAAVSKAESKDSDRSSSPETKRDSAATNDNAPPEKQTHTDAGNEQAGTQRQTSRTPRQDN